MINKVYMVIANYYGDIDYGVDDHVHLCGIYSNMKDALNRANFLFKEVENIKNEKENLKFDWDLYDEEFDPIDEFYSNAESRLGFGIRPYGSDSQKWNVDFRVEEYELGDINDCYLGGAYYME